MMLPSLDMLQPKPYRSDRRTSIHSPHPRVLQGRATQFCKKMKPYSFHIAHPRSLPFGQFGSPIKK